MIVNAARQLGELAAAGKPVCFVGIGLPSTAANLARRLYTPRRCSSTSRVASARSRSACRCRSATANWRRPPTRSSGAQIFAYWFQAGRIDVGFLGGAQLDSSPTSTRPSSVTYDDAAHSPARRRWRARDRRVAGAVMVIMRQSARVRRALRLPFFDRLRRRPGRPRATRAARRGRGG